MKKCNHLLPPAEISTKKKFFYGSHYLDMVLNWLL